MNEQKKHFLVSYFNRDPQEGKPKKSSFLFSCFLYAVGLFGPYGLPTLYIHLDMPPIKDLRLPAGRPGEGGLQCRPRQVNRLLRKAKRFAAQNARAKHKMHALCPAPSLDAVAR